jgi:hypothetical protein
VWPTEIALLDTRVRQVPTLPPNDSWPAATAARALSVPSVAVAHSAKQPVVGAWVRSSGSPLLTALTSSRAALADDLRGRSARVLAIPPGAEGVAISASEVQVLSPRLLAIGL